MDPTQDKDGDSPISHSGRLELTWTNKDLRLVSDEEGRYEWLPSADYRVSEIRLLHHAGTVGDDQSPNALVRGDALHGLTSLAELEPYREKYLGKVRLAYLDPPFNTQQSFLQYDDALEHSVWLTMMRDRLVQVKRLLSPDGSVWVHCDDSEQAYLKILLDELFGRDNFIACVIWESAQGARSDTAIGATHDYVLVYAINRPLWSKKRNPLERSDAQRDRYRNPDNDPRGDWRQGDDGTAKSGSEKNRWPITTPSGRVVLPSEGRYWAFSQETFEKARQEGRVWFGKKGDSLPVIKRYISEVKEGVAPKTWWPASEVGSNQEAKRDHLNKLLPDVTPFETPKPERLLQRIIEIGTDPGDLVLDCFLGSGTTAAVAHKLGRTWVGIERSRDTLSNYTIPRLEKVVGGQDPGGITESSHWDGGGGFQVLDVDRSMFESDEGFVVLAEWATNGKLAEATAAQLHFTHEVEPPFCGYKGKHRLAVVDGIVSEDVVDLLASQLEADELLTLCGTSVDPVADSKLKEIRPGSRTKKIPASLLAEYQKSGRWSLEQASKPTSSFVEATT